MMQPARKAWSSGMTPLHLVVVSTGRSEALGKLHKFRRGLGPQNAEAHQQNRPLGRFEHLERNLKPGFIGYHGNEIGQQRRLGCKSGGLFGRLDRGKVELHGAGRMGGGDAHGAPGSRWRTVLAPIVEFHFVMGV